MLKDVYLADILDSAQEAFPHMWVNGEKYVFSEHVIHKGIQLFKDFKQLVANFWNVKSMDMLSVFKNDLQKLDSQWCIYEQAYIGELMVIERDARRFIYDLIDSLGNKAEFIRAVG